MKKETFYCDACKKELKQEELFALHMYVTKIGSVRKDKTLHICTDCALKVGLVTLDLEEHKPSLSDADALYDIVCDIVSDCTNN